MLYSLYAEEKFNILNKHKVYFTKEQIGECLRLPDAVEKKGEYFASRKDGLKVIYKKEGGMVKIVTFYPVK